MANRAGGARPQNIGHTIRVFVSYLVMLRNAFMLVAPCFYQRFSGASGHLYD